ncbi:heat shock protein 9/12-domain-containing protein [Trametes meyenii]|nr:heat shock protein 9/12-domain-containing protein [Trametes meyenii]
MADAGRQSFTDKASSALKPDSQKSMTEQMGDSMKGTADSIASTLQPQSEKSTTQQMGDSISSNSNENQAHKAKNALGMN